LLNLGHQFAVDELTSNEAFLFSGGFDKTVRQWDILTGDSLHVFIDNKARVNALARNGATLVSCSADNVIRTWNIETKAALLIVTSKQFQSSL
jgi:WD40 repeat protein